VPTIPKSLSAPYSGIYPTVHNMPDQCPLCDRRKEPPSDFCTFHGAALKNLEEAYAIWTKAFDGQLTKEEYYAKVLARSETGRAIRDLINYIRAQGAGG